MSRLIDADELKAFYRHWDSEYSGEELKEYKRIFDDIVDRQPTVDAVPVVRCKDCKHYVEELCWNLYGRCVTVSDMEYCSKGERRDDNETNPD